MSDLPPKQETPGKDWIHVQRIIVAGEFCKSELIVRCKYALYHCFLGTIEQVQYAREQEKAARPSV